MSSKANLYSYSRVFFAVAIGAIINYVIFYALFGLFRLDYLKSGMIGFIAYCTFVYAYLALRENTRMKVLGYIVFCLLLVIGLSGTLAFQVQSVGIEPVLAIIVSILFGAAALFTVLKHIILNHNFSLPPIFRNKVFIAVLMLKLVVGAFFASDFLTRLFVPFVGYFLENPLMNPYQHFFEIGKFKMFPYPPFMLFMLSIPHILLYTFKSLAIFGIFASRISLLIADMTILYFLYRLFPSRERAIVLLYWCSPVVFYITYIHGQLDILPVAVLFASVYFLINRKMLASAVSLGIGLATKSYIFVVVPIYAIYIIKKRYASKYIIGFFCLVAAVYAAFVFPYLSEGFVKLVFFAEEQFRFFNLSVHFTPDLLFYLVPAVYAYIIFKAYSFKKITKDILFVLLGLVLTILITLINPARGWYLWPIPFIIYFFIKEKRLNAWIFAAFNALFILYLLFVQDSDIFNIFQVISPSFSSSQAPYMYLSSLGLPMDIFVSLLFTGLTSTLLYMSYAIYKYGVKSGLIFQKQYGTPVIGISGDSGTGKTTITNSFAEFLGKKRVTVIHGDDMHKWERHDKNWEKVTHLDPIANTIHTNYRQLERLKNGESVERKFYDHGKGKFTSPVLLKPNDIIISEGLHTLFINESNYLYNLKIYADPSPALRILWKVARDTGKRNYKIEDIMKQIETRKKDAEKFISPQKYYSDIIVSYMPEEKIDFKNLKPVKLSLHVYVKNDIPTERLVSRLSVIKGLKINVEYPDHRFQHIMFKGYASKKELEEVLRSLDLDYDEYDIDIENLRESMDGILQILILYCLNERLTIQRADGNAF